MTKAGVGLGQQEWETEMPTMQWRPHLGPLLPSFPVPSCCDVLVNGVCHCPGSAVKSADCSVGGVHRLFRRWCAPPELTDHDQ
jgi:hypothetical protein